MRNKLSIDNDLFTDETISNPYPIYKQIRDTGAAVWSSKHDVWLISRFDDVRAALKADSTLISGRGVTLNSILNDNAHSNTTTLSSDGALHRKRRSVVIKPMMPKALSGIRAIVQAHSDELVDQLLMQDSFDGMSEFSQFLPVNIVSFLVGLPEEGREQMLDWAAAAFNATGPNNARAQAALPSLQGLTRYSNEVKRENLDPKGWAAQVYTAADNGDIDADEIRGLIFDYLAPSLDTTIVGTGHMLYQLGKNPSEFAKLKADPSLIASTIHESLRIGSPVRAFSRWAEEDYQNGEINIPAGDRVAVLYGSANHDERHYPDPERFDISRNPRDHVGYGYGVHRCAGAHLAQLEMECLLNSLIQKVDSIEVEQATPLLSNMLSGYSAFEARLKV